MGIQQMFLGVSAGGDYEVANSLRFNQDDLAYLNRSLSSDGNRKTFTLSWWLKKGKTISNQRIFGLSSTNQFSVMFDGNDCFYLYGELSTSAFASTSNARFRDNSAWYHFVVSVDTTQNTNTDRLKTYVNGVDITADSYVTYPGQDTTFYWGDSSLVHYIGRYSHGSSYHMDNYLSEVHHVDGQALSASDFGETNADTGQWMPKKYSGSYGTNGFYLKFDNTSDLGEDSAGSNDWTANNLSTSAGGGNDSLTDTPTNYGDDTGLGGEVRGNYAVLNPLVNSRFSGNYTLSNGNLKTVHTSYATLPSTLAVSSGKWYCEGTLDAVASASNQAWCGLMRVDAEAHWTGSSPYQNIPIEYWQGNTPLYGVNFWGDGLGLNRTQSYGSSYATAGTVIGIAFDADSGSCTWYINGSSQGSSTYNIVQGETYYFVFGAYLNGAWTANFGARPFAYAAPSGYKCLCAQNLSDPTIADSSSHFDVKLWDGNTSTTHVTGVNFQPDLVWIKNRSGASSQDHVLFDIIRGPVYIIESNTNATQYYDNNTISSFNSDGWTTGSSYLTNRSAYTYVGWAWKAGGTAVSNSDGSLTSQVSANQTAGFSISTFNSPGSYDSSTWGHGLGQAPDFVMMKHYGNSGNWQCYHSSIPSNSYMQLNSTGGVSGSNNWTVTSTTVTCGAGLWSHNNTATVAYHWSEVEGYSKFGRYYGGGGTYGYPFVYTGFKPAFVMIKSGTAGQSWIMWDSERSTYNVADEILNADNANTEAAWSDIDILSNGFKIRDTHASVNTNGHWYYFAAFAETPLKYSNAR